MGFNDAIKNTIHGSIVYESDILTSSMGQRYKIVVNKIIWYAIRVLIEIDPRLAQKTLFKITGSIINVFKIKQCLTFSSAKEEADKLINVMKKHRLVVQSNADHLPFPLQSSGRIRICYLSIINGEEALKNPDLCFLPGDHVQVKRTVSGLTYHHAAIYIGNKRVIQVSDPDAGHSKERARVNEADWSAFHCGDSEFIVCFPKLKFRSNPDVVKMAKSKIGLYENQYKVFSKNCQHFATSCQFDVGFITEI